MFTNGYGGKGGPKDADGLTPRQAAFVVEFLKDPTNGTQAARRAGYSKSGAAVNASDNLKNPLIALKIREHQARQNRKARKTLDDLQAELEKMAFVNVQRIADKDISEISEDDAAAILELTTTETMTESDRKVVVSKGRKVRLADKVGAGMALAKLNGWIIDRQSLGGGPSGNDAIPIEVKHTIKFVKASK